MGRIEARRHWNRLCAAGVRLKGGDLYDAVLAATEDPEEAARHYQQYVLEELKAGRKPEK